MGLLLLLRPRLRWVPKADQRCPDSSAEPPGGGGGPARGGGRRLLLEGVPQVLRRAWVLLRLRAASQLSVIARVIRREEEKYLHFDIRVIRYLSVEQKSFLLPVIMIGEYKVKRELFFSFVFHCNILFSCNERSTRQIVLPATKYNTKISHCGIKASSKRCSCLIN